MNELVAVIAALVGSSGIASILAGGTQFRRTHKLQGQIKELDASKKLLADQPRERAALEAATSTVALDLAAHFLIKSDARQLVLLGFVGTSVSGFLMIGFGFAPALPAGFSLFPLLPRSSADVPLVIAGVAVVLAGYVALFIYVYLKVSRRRRERFIARVLVGPGETDSSSILIAAHAFNDSTASPPETQAAGAGARHHKPSAP